MVPAGRLTPEELRAEVIRLGPWHIDVEVTPEVSTAVSLEAPPGTYPEEAGRVSFSRRYEGVMARLRRMFPRGLEGRSVMDCACNCGAYLFWSKEHGAGRCFGFDVREHWIAQARFLAAHREKPADDVTFEVCDLHDLPQVSPGRFDVTWFNGILYHLPDPVFGLKLAADLTDELLIVNTATKAGYPDGALVMGREKPGRILAGTQTLNWFPTGPEVLTGILNWLGFPEVRCSAWRTAPQQESDLDRIEVLAAREARHLADYDAAWEGEDSIAHWIATTIPPRSRVAVLGRTAPPEVPGREMAGVELPAGGDEGAGERVIAAIERERDAGARYLASTAEGLAFAAAHPPLARWLAAHEVIASVTGTYEARALAGAKGGAGTATRR